MSIVTKLPPHIILDSFLPDDLHQSLLDMFLTQQDHFTASMIKEGTLDPKIRQSSSFTIAKPLKEQLAHSITKQMDNIFAKFGTQKPHQPLFEFSAVAHQDGDFYQTHSDVEIRKPGAARLVSCVYYLYKEPKSFSGGQLRLYSFDKKNHLDINPQNNGIVFFPSMFLHEVLPIKVPSREFLHSRFSIPGWIKG